jgi:hypothetical protein
VIGHHKRPAVIFGLAMSALALLALAWHLSAIAVYNGTVGDRSLDERIAAARTAERIEPWNAHFEWRRVTLEAEKLLAQGKIDEAFWMLQPYALSVRGDALYRTVYQRTVTLKAPLDARKAHVQHGKEKADGSLDPSDIQR